MAEICADFGIVYYYNQEKEIEILKELFSEVDSKFLKLIDKV